MEDHSSTGAEFGRRLRHARLDRGLSQNALAEGICSASAISRWEAGVHLPPEDAIWSLANRLGIDVSVLTGLGFDTRFAESPDRFAEVISAGVENCSTFDDCSTAPRSPIANWLQLARSLLNCVDPWSGQSFGNVLVDRLEADPLTDSSPVALETMELFRSLVVLRENPARAQLESLVNTLKITPDAPQVLRQKAVEIAVAVLVCENMPLASIEVIRSVKPKEITYTTWFLLGINAAERSNLPTVARARSIRDRAFILLEKLCSTPGISRHDTQEILNAVSGEDRLVGEIFDRMM